MLEEHEGAEDWDLGYILPEIVCKDEGDCHEDEGRIVWP